MKFVLVYVDAENVNACEVDHYMDFIKGQCTDGEMVKGKFYGAYGVISDSMRACYGHGMEFVETSSIITGQKNITDMKLTVDCIADALLFYRDSLSKVYILSKDCDFTPLIYKLAGQGIEVAAPLYDVSKRHLTLGDLNVRLKELDYNPIVNGAAAFENQFSCLRGMLGQEFSDDMIDSYLEHKRKKFFQSISVMCSQKQLEEMQEVPVREFCFADVARAMRTKLESIAKQYTIKYYGFSFKDREMGYFVQEYLRGNGFTEKEAKECIAS